MRLRIRQVDRTCLTGHQADQALVGSHYRAVHGVAIEAFGCIQFERRIDAQHIDGADLRNHVGGDQHHDLVKALLRADRLRHDFAKPTQQHARTTKRATHGVGPSGRAMTGAEPVTRRSSSKRNSPGAGPKANVLKAISNAACKPQAKDSGMTDQAIVRRNANAADQAALSSPYSACSVRTASSVKAPSIKSENFISEVVIARMLMDRSANALNACAATPASLRMPMPITETLATSVALSRRV